MRRLAPSGSGRRPVLRTSLFRSVGVIVTRRLFRSQIGSDVRSPRARVRGHRTPRCPLRAAPRAAPRRAERKIGHLSFKYSSPLCPIGSLAPRSLSSTSPSPQRDDGADMRCARAGLISTSGLNRTHTGSHTVTVSRDAHYAFNEQSHSKTYRHRLTPTCMHIPATTAYASAAAAFTRAQLPPHTHTRC